MLPLVPLKTIFTLTEPWSFSLHRETRNHTFAQHSEISWSDERDGDYRLTKRDETPRAVTLPVGTRLTLDRIYVRQSCADYDSVTFRCNVGAKKGPRGRFWVKLPDTYSMKVECEMMRDPDKPILSNEAVLAAALGAIKEVWRDLETYVHSIRGWRCTPKMVVAKQTLRKDGRHVWGVCHYHSRYAVVVIGNEEGDAVEETHVVDIYGAQKISHKSFLCLKKYDNYSITDGVPKGSA